MQGSLCSPDTININLGVSPNTQSHPRYQLLQLTCAASCNRSRTSQKAFNNNKKIPYSIFVFLIVRNNQSWMIFLTGEATNKKNSLIFICLCLALTFIPEFYTFCAHLSVEKEEPEPPSGELIENKQRLLHCTLDCIKIL